MSEASPVRPLRGYNEIATVVVVVVGYVVALVDVGNETPTPLSALELGALIAAGLLFLGLSVREEAIISRLPRSWGALAYILLLLALFAFIYLLFDTVNGTWLLGMPLIGQAFSRLRLHWSISVAGLYLFIIGLPVSLSFGLDTALSLVLSVLPAVIFVALFVLLLVREERARNKAEQLAEALERANRQLGAYATQAEELAVSKERNRLAREIHDNIGHYLTVINVQLNAARVILDQDRERALDAMEKAQRLSQEGLAAVRQSVAALRESPLGDRPLDATIASLLEETRSAGLVAELAVRGEPRPLEAQTALTLYRVVQEGLTNVRKHARASRVDVILDFSVAEQVKLTVKDNGIGADTVETGGFGLLGLRERVQLLGGRLDIDTAPGDGFRTTATVPG
ncbi:MAG: sensor histidine kinase [Candidatus Promineifilaceae bacterium]|nr:sensor histidine kinase [Candidatus Promineifilaceae bacterium]